MSIELKVPVLPESVSDATIASWHKKPGEAVARDENLVDLETDKVVLEVPSPVDGVLKEIKFDSGDTVTSQQVLAIIEEGAAAGANAPAGAESARDEETPAKAAAKPEKPAAKEEKQPARQAPKGADELSPAARRVATEKNIDPSQVEGTGRDGRVTKEDVVNFARDRKAAPSPQPSALSPVAGDRPEERVPMTRIRARIAERLMHAKDSIAMLTSSNEVNLANVMAMRKQLGEQFQKTHGVKLGFMSFFVRAACEALKRFPVVNASVDDNDIIYHGYQDISIAVSTDRGLVTPVLRDAQAMSFADIEQAIGDFATRAREGGLKLEELQGGTFGSLFSTPIVNPPQSAILGMHTIKERAIVENGQVVAAPMMYIALSYDHRIVDGRDAVLFLVDIKNQLENPHRMLLGL
jgi:2-oxoglutarate dehydrogenase E2 component (dihydrolipoamide succinyltransferase)